MMLQPEGWKLDSRKDFPLVKRRGGGTQTVGKGMKGEWEGGFAPGETSHARINGGGSLFFGGRIRCK